MRKLEDWIEYMEGEGLLKLMGRLGMLLRYSSTDQLVLDNLRRLRRILKNSDPALDIENEISSSEFLGNFHADTMARIVASQKPKAPKANRMYAKVKSWAEIRHQD